MLVVMRLRLDTTKVPNLAMFVHFVLAVMLFNQYIVSRVWLGTVAFLGRLAWLDRRLCLNTCCSTQGPWNWTLPGIPCPFLLHTPPQTSVDFC
jgi:hypothetical protein